MKFKKLTSFIRVLILAGLSCVTYQTNGQVLFLDNFNRSDSTSVGNGWLDASDNPSGVKLGIINNSLSGAVVDNSAAVYRPLAVNKRPIELRLSLPITMAIIVLDRATVLDFPFTTMELKMAATELRFTGRMRVSTIPR